jgi:hypothetical protein
MLPVGLTRSPVDAQLRPDAPDPEQPVQSELLDQLHAHREGGRHLVERQQAERLAHSWPMREQLGGLPEGH